MTEGTPQQNPDYIRIGDIIAPPEIPDPKDTIGNIVVVNKMYRSSSDVTLGTLMDEESAQLSQLAGEQLVANTPRVLGRTDLPQELIKEALERIQNSYKTLRVAPPERLNTLQFLLSVNEIYKSLQFASYLSSQTITDSESERSALLASATVISNLPDTIQRHAKLRGETLPTRLVKDINYLKGSADDVQGLSYNSSMRNFLSHPSDKSGRNDLERTIIQPHFNYQFPTPRTPNL